MSVLSTIKSYFQHFGSTPFTYTYDYRKTPIKGLFPEEVRAYLVQFHIFSPFLIEEVKLRVYMRVDGKPAPKCVGYWKYNASPEIASSLVLVGYGVIKNKYLRGRKFDLNFVLEKDKIVIYLELL